MKKILVVDDNQVILNALTNYLRFKFKDCTILAAGGGQEAIETIDAMPVDLLLTDLDMPEVDGYQLGTYVKQKFPAIPVIFMTGSWSLDLQMLVSKSGVVRCIEKPFRFEEIETIIREALNNNAATMVKSLNKNSQGVSSLCPEAQ